MLITVGFIIHVTEKLNRRRQFEDKCSEATTL